MAPPRRISRQDAERAGRIAEHVAALWLRAKGYQILETRYRCRAGEIDLIARKGRTLCFIEVKARPRHDLGLEAITPIAERRITSAATQWTARHAHLANLERRFDVITIARGRPRHHRNAFRPGDNQPIVNPNDFF